ncbi:23S rRNA (pseudouridine(1915)-N(3))-methyltransferase RlmH [Aureimonas fodinaquatilis]|uniref:Ribosomal RNA large subunit methyltransferase H n=1 Tax=Aureimonas fodinaquatilis TaxID=2565783 RepID=A0A5B0DUX9_9HYPH|nr:23S rRNA (pseudouridine(1915)-N(3))-methyltransferase RlmH [Aureimonas fodinaquatilis]KAA0969755.1 23S rRNA (pseudouridine(1915)-N(3))-methyltransferase RlmH [Aureimonas fodinaquatilis]
MRITILAIGRMKAGPEQELAARYLDRLKKSGSALGLDFSGVVELPESRSASVDARKKDEAERLLAATPDKAALMLMDETGKTPNSEQFARQLADFRDEPLRDLAIIIGGPDGLLPELKEKARYTLALGRLTWPHQLARILLSEQLYRATTILSGHPYHRN